jgi:hypothetical protein
LRSRNLIRHRSRTLFALLLLALSTACVGCFGNVHYGQNQEIPDQLRDEIHALNDTIVQGVLARNPERILELFVDEFAKRPAASDQVRQLTELMSKYLSGSDITVFHEFDVTFSTANSGLWALVSNVDDGFIVHVHAVRKRLYVSLLSAKDPREERLLGLIYIRDGDSWRLYDLRFGLFRVNGRSALEWAEEAKRMRDNGLAVPAQLRFTVAKSILRPLPYWQYVNESTVTKLGETISNDLAQLPKLPLQLSDVPSKPTIYAISPEFVEGRLSAVVQYITTLKRSDEMLKPEVEAISRHLSNRFPGLCAGSERVAYRAFDQAPADPAVRYTYFGVVYDCKKGAVESERASD